MKTKLASLALFSALALAGSATAQTAQAPAPAQPEAAAPGSMRVDQTVYTQRLPAVADLTSPAATQGRTIERIEQNASQVTVSYKSSNGQITTVAYLLLSGASAPQQVAYAPQQVVTPGSPAPTVVYAAPQPSVVYYADSPYYYGYGYPRYYYPPVSIGLGFHGGYYRGGYGYRGGFHH